MNHDRITRSRGSIYVLTLLTVAAVGSLIMIGVSLRTTRNSQSVIIERMNTNSNGVLDGTELAIGRIANDTNWVTNAQKGVVFSEFTLGNRTYSSSVLDADTLLTPTASSSNYKVTVTSTSGLATESASFELIKGYYTYLQTLGLDAYWALNEPSKSTIAVEPEDDRDGTYLDPNAAGAGTNDEGGTVPVFAGSGDEIETVYDTGYNEDEEGTVSFWMKFTGTGKYTTYGVFGQRYKPGGMPGVTMTCIGGSLSAYMSDTGSFSYSKFASTGPNLVNDSQWHHVAMTWGPAGLKIYIDGNQESGTGNTDTWNTMNGSDGKQPLLIGGGYIASLFSQPKVGFVGSIAHFAILETQLKASTIAELAKVKPDNARVLLTDGSWEKVFE